MKASSLPTLPAVLLLFGTCLWTTVELRGQPAATAVEQAEFRVVVLRNGNALAGRFEQAGDRVTVSQGPEHMVRVPIRDIDFIVASWKEAYRLQRSRLRSGELNDRLQLAQWCLRYDLVDQAADLLLELSRQHPHNQAVKALEHQLTRRVGALEPVTASAPMKVQTASFETELVEAPAEGKDSAASDAANQLTLDLEPATITEFTRTIQPLLLNRCGMANCHASTGPSAFRLQKVALGKLTQRDLTWTNLREVFKQIDPDEPQRSALLTKAAAPHGKLRRAPIDAHQVRQRERLQQWVASVVADEESQQWVANQSETVAPQPNPTTGGISPGLARIQSGQITLTSATEPVEEEQSADAASPTEEEVPKSAEKDREPKGPAASSADPYDPSQFNARFHK